MWTVSRVPFIMNSIKSTAYQEQCHAQYEVRLSLKKNPQTEASLSIILLLTDLQPTTVIINPNHHYFLHHQKSSAAPADWVFRFRSPLQHMSTLPIASHYLISSLIIFNHLHNNNCNLYGFYHLLSRLLLFPTLYSVNGNYLLLVLRHLCWFLQPNSRERIICLWQTLRAFHGIHFTE